METRIKELINKIAADISTRNARKDVLKTEKTCKALIRSM